MTASHDMDALVTEALERYADAREAVDAFELQIHELLFEAIEQKRDWQNFRPQPGSERGRGKPLFAGTKSGTEGRSIWATQNSAVDGDGYILIGLWWGPPRRRDDVVAYCHRADKRYQVIELALGDPKPGVECARLDQNKAQLFVVLKQDAILPEVFRVLLDELDRALAANPK